TRSSARMTICKTNSRKSAPSFTSRPPPKLADPPVLAEDQLGRKRNRVPALNQAQVLAAAMAMSSMRNSKSSTKTRKSKEDNLSAAPKAFGVAGSTQNRRSKEDNVWQQLM